MYFPVVRNDSVVKKIHLPIQALIHGSGRSPGGGNGNALQCLAWEISWTEKPGGLESQRGGHHLATKEQQQCNIR